MSGIQLKAAPEAKPAMLGIVLGRAFNTVLTCHLQRAGWIKPYGEIAQAIMAVEERYDICSAQGVRKSWELISSLAKV
jgi:hypothetical protein